MQSQRGVRIESLQSRAQSYCFATSCITAQAYYKESVAGTASAQGAPAQPIDG
jgi:hypothetical protein